MVERSKLMSAEVEAQLLVNYLEAQANEKDSRVNNRSHISSFELGVMRGIRLTFQLFKNEKRLDFLLGRD